MTWHDAHGRDVRPFLAVALVGLLSLALPPYAEPGGTQVAAAAGAAVVTAVLAWLAVRLPPGHRLVDVPPLLFFVVAGLASYAAGGESWGLGPLIMLPLLWFVLHGTVGALRAATVATGLFFLLPLLLVGPPRYDASEWRRALAWVLVVAVLCPTLQQVVGRLRASVHEQSRLAGELTSVLRAATEHAIIATDLEGRITLFSEGAERMLGRTAARTVGQLLTVLHLPGELAARAAALGVPDDIGALVADVPATGSSVRSWSYRRADGSTLPVRATVTRLQDDGGRHVGWIRVATDVTAEEAARRELVRSEERWRSLVDLLPGTTVLVVGADLTYRVAVGVEAHRAARSLEGRTLFETSSDVVAPVLEPLYRQALQGRPGRVELSAGHGGVVLEVHAVPLPAPAGAPEVLVVARDVTADRQREAELRRALERSARLFDEAPHGTLLIDPDGVISEVNPALCALLSRPAEALLGAHVSDLPFRLDEASVRLAELLRAGGPSRLALEGVLRVPAQPQRDVSLTAVTLRSPAGGVDGVLVTLIDVSERKRYEQRLADLADHDPLTGLANRRKFDAELASHLDRCRRYGPQGALILLDLDDFKQVNDTLGHSVGDQLIVSVASVLRHRMRTADVVARLGGDEFAILLPHADRAGAESVAADVVELVRSDVRVMDGRRTRKVTASLGVVLVQDLDTSPGELISTADMTMYDAKEAGRDQFLVHDTSVFAVPRTGARIAWLDRIARALEDDRFVVHAQPVLDLSVGRVTGAELLIRMLDEDSQLIAPGRFLYIAERTELIRDIDVLMAGHAVRLLEQLQQIDPDFALEVNLSGHSVGSPRLAEHIDGLVRDHRIDPHGLVFEITETAAVAHIEVARSFAEDIGALGCRFALDDFGAGFGSFYYLKHLLFDFIKIDGEFVASSPSNPTDRLILTSIVEIARGMGKETIAEFVADEEILEVVRGLGVDHAQGFHIGRPEPVARLVERVRAGVALPG